MSDFRAPRCPGCDEPPMMALAGGRQAFCGNDECQVLTWDMTDDPAKFKAKAERIELPELGSEIEIVE